MRYSQQLEQGSSKAFTMAFRKGNQGNNQESIASHLSIFEVQTKKKKRKVKPLDVADVNHGIAGHKLNPTRQFNNMFEVQYKMVQMV